MSTESPLNAKKLDMQANSRIKNSKLSKAIFIKDRHPQFKSAPPQLRDIVDNQIDCGIAIADLQNLTCAIPQLSAVSCQFRYFLVPLPKLRMVVKITKNIFSTFFFLEPKTCLKGTVARDF
jgi:hypothetical protein